VIAYFYFFAVLIVGREDLVLRSVVVPDDCSHGYDAVVADGYVLVTDYFHLSVDKRVAYGESGVVSNLNIRTISYQNGTVFAPNFKCGVLTHIETCFKIRPPHIAPAKQYIVSYDDRGILMQIEIAVALRSKVALSVLHRQMFLDVAEPVSCFDFVNSSTN
jgi:hypothetical protein